MTLPSRGPVTAGFAQPRPLTREEKTHIHGAWDIAGPIGREIVSPEDGHVYYCLFLRPPDSSKSISNLTDRMKAPFDFDGHYYWGDIYGSMIIVAGKTGRVHVLTHSYQNQLQNRGLGATLPWEYVEEELDKRHPLRALHTFSSALKIHEGRKIGYIGNSGFSTGPHVHWEIHRGRKWNRWEDRIDPADYFPKVEAPRYG